MNSISNDFVTIEYKESQKEIAEYVLELFNKEPELYKGLLNGKTIIHSEELPTINHINKDEETKESNKRSINKAIMIMNGASDKIYPFDDKSTTDIYDSIIDFIHSNPDENRIKEIGITLAYDYFKKTKDFECLEEYLYGDGISDDDIMELCVFNIADYYDDLLREKIHKDVLSLSKDESITKNFNGIMTILMSVANNMNSKFNNKNISPKELYKKLKKNPISQIDDKQFEVLVREILKYIDPTEELLEEYIKCRSENKIEEKKTLNWNEASCFYKDKEDYGIKLYKKGNLTDVITLIHEFGHLHYINKANNEPHTIFDEYPSIYYELKAVEYLTTVGYSEEDINFATLFRYSDNLSNLTHLLPIIQSVHINIGKEKEEYDLNPIKKILNIYDKKINISYFETVCTKEEIEELKAQLEEKSMCMKLSMLQPETDLVSTLKYIVGTFFAEDAINNLEHEEVLKILDTVTQGEYSLYDVLKIQGLIPSSNNQQDKPYQKEKIDDIDNQ